MAVLAEFNFYPVFGGSRVAYSGFPGGHGPELWQTDDYLSGGCGTVFSDRTFILRTVCAFVRLHLAALRRRSCRRRNSVPGSCAAAELYWGTQLSLAGFSLHGGSRCIMGRSSQDTSSGLH